MSEEFETEPIQQRDLNDYPYLSAQGVDISTGEFLNLKAVPTRIYLYKGEGTLSVEVWESDEDFNNRVSSSNSLSRHLPIDSEVASNYAELFTMISTSALEFLELSNDFEIELLEIDLNLLKVKVLARHKTKLKRVSEDETTTWQEFEEIKQQFPEIVQGFIGFAFEYMKSNEVLARFE